jgi:radical SAM protein (TIGR01212 family)
MKQILTFGKYLREKFGVKVYKVPIALSGFTCPNIDGTITRGGCTFCENESFNPTLNKSEKIKSQYINFQTTKNPLLNKQLAELEFQFKTITEKLKKNYKAEKFLVYFQAFTNTYAPLETLKELYEKALSFENVVGLSIGTRTDSINFETLEYLAELSEKSEIWVEYGIQSIFDETLNKINRGHDFKNIETWIKNTKKYNLNICGHLIYGLPDETDEMMQKSFDKSLELGINSLKIHPLYIVKKTALANQFRRGKFKPISEEKYIHNLIVSLKKLPENISVQRLTAGIENNSLLAPKWCLNKQESLKKIRAELEKNGIRY